MIQGTEILLGNEKYILAPLNFASLIKLDVQIKKLSQIGGIPTVDQLGSILDIVLASIHRNHSEVTKEELKEWVDIANMNEILSIVMGNSGLKKTVIVNAPMAATSPSTGETSTQS